MIVVTPPLFFFFFFYIVVILDSEKCNIIFIESKTLVFKMWCRVIRRFYSFGSILFFVLSLQLNYLFSVTSLVSLSGTCELERYSLSSSEKTKSHLTGFINVKDLKRRSNKLFGCNSTCRPGVLRQEKSSFYMLKFDR